MSSERTDTTSPPAAGAAPELERAILVSLDGLLRALELEPLDDDRFRARCVANGFGDRLFGGQLAAQALLAGGRTVADKVPHSLHAYFVEVGSAERSLDLAVERVRDGKSVSTRRVTISQGDRTLLVAMASFHSGPTSPEHADPPLAGPRPQQLPLLQAWIREMPPQTRQHAMSWIEQPPPLELRFGEPLNFLGGPCSEEPRVYWLRLPRDVGDDPLLHSTLLAYASDYFLTDAALRRHPERHRVGPSIGFSLDHALWIHRPVRLDRWHQYTQQAQAIAGHRALVRGFLHDAEGNLVASVMQENLIRVAG